MAEQKPYTMKRLEEMLKSLDNWELTGTCTFPYLWCMMCVR